MREFHVSVPIAGVAYITVQAESEEDAITQAIENCHLDDIAEWEPLRYITRGNVCYAPQWEAEATDMGEVDDE